MSTCHGTRCVLPTRFPCGDSVLRVREEVLHRFMLPNAFRTTAGHRVNTDPFPPPPIRTHFSSSQMNLGRVFERGFMNAVGDGGSVRPPRGRPVDASYAAATGPSLDDVRVAAQYPGTPPPPPKRADVCLWHVRYQRSSPSMRCPSQTRYRDELRASRYCPLRQHLSPLVPPPLCLSPPIIIAPLLSL
jgi:hypothetical protein